MGRCLQAKLSKKYWVRALNTATHIRNLTVSANSNEGKSPFELFTGKTARRNHLRVFGCTTYLKKRKVNLRKLDSRSVKAKLIGYDNNSTAYILQELATKHAMYFSKRTKFNHFLLRKKYIKARKYWKVQI